VYSRTLPQATAYAPESGRRAVCDPSPHDRPHQRARQGRTRRLAKLSDELDVRLRLEAKRRGKTISELTREAIEAHLVTAPRTLLAAGAGQSGRSDVSERIEEILREEWNR
jgi:predicted DNA-binding protein